MFITHLSAMRVKIKEAVAAANGADGAFKEKIINGVKQQQLPPVKNVSKSKIK